MKKYLGIIMLFVLGGCAGLSDTGVKNLTRIQFIEMGMTKEDVRSVMGQEVVVGYEITDIAAGTTKPLTMANPYRVETVKDNERLLDVEFYLTHIRQPDGTVSDDELTPLVFDNNKLVAKGWTALNKIRSKGQ